MAEKNWFEFMQELIKEEANLNKDDPKYEIKRAFFDGKEIEYPGRDGTTISFNIADGQMYFLMQSWDGRVDWDRDYRICKSYNEPERVASRKDFFEEHKKNASLESIGTKEKNYYLYEGYCEVHIAAHKLGEPYVLVEESESMEEIFDYINELDDASIVAYKDSIDEICKFTGTERDSWPIADEEKKEEISAEVMKDKAEFILPLDGSEGESISEERIKDITDILMSNSKLSNSEKVFNLKALQLKAASEFDVASQTGNNKDIKTTERVVLETDKVVLPLIKKCEDACFSDFVKKVGENLVPAAKYPKNVLVAAVTKTVPLFTERKLLNDYFAHNGVKSEEQFLKLLQDRIPKFREKNKDEYTRDR